MCAFLVCAHTTSVSGVIRYSLSLFPPGSRLVHCVVACSPNRNLAVIVLSLASCDALFTLRAIGGLRDVGSGGPPDGQCVRHRHRA